MVINRFYRRLIKIAIFTIPLIAVLGIAPLTLLGAPSRPPPGSIIVGFFVIFFNILFAWVINIGALIIISTQKYSPRKADIIRWAMTYLLMIVWISVAIGITPSFVKKPDPLPAIMPYLAGFSINTIILVLIALITSQHRETNTKVENAELRMANLQAQQEKLKHQLHPHFLFNSLNALKTLIKRDSANAEDYLIKLSDFLRFSVTHFDHDLVFVKDELKFVSDYLSMQKTRFKEGLQFTIQIPGDVLENGRLPVFSLQLLAENAIKHNMLTLGNPLRIDLCYRDGYLIMKNNLQSKLMLEPSTAIGLQNLNTRYKILCNEPVKIEREDGEFRVTVKVL